MLFRSPQKIRAVSGYVYRAPWNSSGQFVFVSKNFRALMIPEDFEEEALQRMERGCTVRLCGTCSLPENARNPGEFNQSRYLAGKMVRYIIRPGPGDITYLNEKGIRWLPPALLASRVRTSVIFHPYPQVIEKLFNAYSFGPPVGFTQPSTCSRVDRKVSRLQPLTKRPVQTRFRFGSVHPCT